MSEQKGDIVVALRKKAASSRGMEGDYCGEQYATDDLLLEEAADEIERLRADCRWIPVSERLPEHIGCVVCRTESRELQFGRVMTVTKYIDGKQATTKHWRGYPDRPLDVTHWTDLPSPPEVVA